MSDDGNRNDRDPPSPRVLSVDWDQYKAMLKDSDLTDAQKQEFVETLWSIIVTFVDLGFGLHPVQSVHSDGQIGSKALEAAIADVVNSDPLPNPQSDSAADLDDRGEQEESCAAKTMPIAPSRRGP